MRPLKSFLLPFLASFLLLSVVYAPAVESRRPPRVVPCAIIPALNGDRLSGHVFGKGGVAVILAHMYPDDQSQWYDFALFLSERGYQVLTFDFRGFGESEGYRNVPDVHRDVRAAITYLQARGAKDIYLVGASMGGTASLRAVAGAGRRLSGVSGVVTVSSPVEILGLSLRSAMSEIKVPAMFIAAEYDEAAVTSARWFYDNARGPRQIRILPGTEHGTDILNGAYAWQLQEVVLGFLQQFSPTPQAIASGLPALQPQEYQATQQPLELPGSLVPLSPNE